MFGNLLDPGSEISEVLSREPFQVIHPEHGTRPQVFYIGLDHDALEVRAARDHV
jgi:tetrathionate reductase subunit B